MRENVMDTRDHWSLAFKTFGNRNVPLSHRGLAVNSTLATAAYATGEKTYHLLGTFLINVRPPFIGFPCRNC